MEAIKYTSQHVSVPQMPLTEQQGPEQGTTDILEQMGSKDIANELTNYDWELFTAMHEVSKFYIWPHYIN